MKKLFVVLAVLFSSSTVFAMGEDFKCSITDHRMAKTYNVKCTRYLQPKDAFDLYGYMGNDLTPYESSFNVVREKNGNFRLDMTSVNGEEFDLGKVTTSTKQKGCYVNKYYNICLK